MRIRASLLLASLAAIVAITLPAGVFAVDVFPACQTPVGGTTDVCKDVGGTSGNPVVDTIKNIIEIVSIATGVAAIIIIIISGLRMVVSSGDTKAVEQARSGIIYAVAGIAVALTAQAIVVFVLNKL